MDIISNMKKGKKGTLADIITLNFRSAKSQSHKDSDIRVEVPKLDVKAKRPSAKEKKTSVIKQPAVDINSILNNIFKNIGNAPTIAEKAEKDKAEEAEARLTEEKEEAGGYGTSRRSAYAAGIISPYTDYGKLFSYLGAFKANTGQEIESAAQMMGRVMDESGKFFFLDREVIDMGVKHIKYFNMGLKLSGDMSAVPLGNVNSKDWEMFKLWSKIDPVMYKLKMDTI